MYSGEVGFVFKAHASTARTMVVFSLIISVKIAYPNTASQSY